MPVTVELYQLQQVINEVALKYAAIGAAQALQIAGVSKACVSRREAERLYGARTVARWITEGRIRPVQKKERGRLRINVQELLDAATSENKLIKKRKETRYGKDLGEQLEGREAQRAEMDVAQPG